MSPRRLDLALPVALVVAVALPGGYVALGGADFRPMQVTPPCSARPVPRPGADLDRLAQALVLDATRSAACELGVTREELLLALPSPGDRDALLRRSGRTEPELEQALQTGLTSAVDKLDRAGALPSSSELVSAYKDAPGGLPSTILGLVDSIPDDTLDRFLPVPAILRDAVGRLDTAAILADIDDPDALQREVSEAITDATLAQLRQVAADQAPSFLRDLFG